MVNEGWGASPASEFTNEEASVKRNLICDSAVQALVLV